MDIIGSFTTIEPLGAGPLGELFRARDTRSGRMVALRLVDRVLAADPARRERLLACVRDARGISDPRVVALVDSGEAGGRLYLAHEFRGDQSLAAILAGGPLAPALAATVAAEVADALASAAEKNGLVHAVLEPANILVGPDGRVSILHLGLAQWTGRGAAREEAARHIQEEGGRADAAVRRQAQYLSPEQVLGEPADHKSDLFVLGVILHEMLTGRVPFEGDSPSGTALKIVQAPPVPPSQSNAAVPPELDAIVLRALAKSRDARYTSGRELAADLRELAGRLQAAKPSGREIALPAVPGRAAGRPAKTRVRALLAACALVALLAAAAWFGRNAFGLPWRDAPAPAPQPIVLVMPFAVAGEPPSTHFGPGFAEDLAARLAEVPGTTVVGRLSLRDANDADWQTRARAHRATAAVRGTTRPGAGSIDVTVQLFDVATGAMTWSGRFSTEKRRAPALEIEIAGRLASALGLSAPTNARWARNAARQADPDAYDLYLQGRDAAEHRDRARAIALFGQAIERDPRLVEARASLAMALYLEEFYAGGTRDPGSEGRALREAEAALAVDPELPTAHLATALAAPTIPRAASALTRAIASDPSNGEVWHHAGDLLAEFDPAGAIAIYRVSLALEPTIDANHRDIAAAEAALGRRAEADRALATGEAARPDRPWWKQMRARFDILDRQYERAIASLGSEPSVESTPIVWAMARVVPLAMAGKAAAARTEAEQLVARFPVFCEGRALLAGADADAGDVERGRAAAKEILTAARRPDAPPSMRACAALAAAGMGEAAQAGDWLGRVAADDQAFRLWTRQATFGLALSFESAWYPWNKVASSAPVVNAAGQLDRSGARARDEVRSRLLPLPPFTRQLVR